MNIPFSATAGIGDINGRLDRFIHDFYERTYPRRFSRSEIQKAIKEGRFMIHGKVETKSSTRLKEGDVITGSLEEKERVVPVDTDFDIEVLYEDEWMLVIDKPAGIQVHPSGNGEGKILTDWIKANRPALLTVGGDISRPGIVHRLDRDTSGLLVIAKTDESFAALKELFHDRLVEKTYQAVLYGNLPETEGTISFPLARKKDSLKRVPVRKNTNYSGKIRNAVTDYRVIHAYPQFDYVEAYPKTGRTHQIRAHFAALRHPVIGDTLYMSKDEKNLTLEHPTRQLLHATRLSFDLFGKHHDFESPLPLDFKSFLAKLDA
jgi:23S rRNA pseudouridine1911/1915/1917 synthase